MKKMKLSEAILKGCKGTKQGHGNYSMDPDEEDGPVCVLGAAMRGLKRRENPQNSYDYLVSKFPRLGGKHYPSLPYGYRGEQLLNQIWYLNDTEEWPREKIARALAKRGQ